MAESVRQLWTALRAALYASGFVLLWSWAALTVRLLDHRLGVSLPGWLVPVGAVLVLAGGTLALACVLVFVHTGRGTPAPFDPPRRFVATGPYHFVRNPMYVGGLSVILGAGLLLRSPSIAALALAFLGVMHLFVTLYEEPSLERRFGESYLQYTREVQRWLPRARAACATTEEES